MIPTVFGHEAAALAGTPSTIGNPLYDILPEHVAGLVLALLLPVGGVAVQWLAADGRAWARALVNGYAELGPRLRLVVWLLAVSAAVHLGLAVGHGTGSERLAFALAGIAFALVARRVVVGRGEHRWRPYAAAVILTSIVAYWIAALAGSAPDQVGLATKVVELLTLILVLQPAPGRQWRGAARTILVIALVVGSGVSGWVGAFQATAIAGAADSASAGGSAGSSAGGETGHEHGSVPPPGSVLPALADREPTAEEAAAADAAWRATRTGIAAFADPTRAAAAGYDVAGMYGLDFHAGNPALEGDGRIFDPGRPESLVYALSPAGRPVLLGAMFMMPRVGVGGPAVGGPLTVWHAHENVCLTLFPPGLSGLQSPLGGCPVGSILFPTTAEMIHVWVAPDAPSRFGDLDTAWRAAYVAQVDAEADAARPAAPTPGSP